MLDIIPQWHSEMWQLWHNQVNQMLHHYYEAISFTPCFYYLRS